MKEDWLHEDSKLWKATPIFTGLESNSEKQTLRKLYITLKSSSKLDYKHTLYNP